jgi:hypothetical protein
VSKNGNLGVKPVKGDQKVFSTLEKAREFAYNQGYIVFFEEKEKSFE